MILSVKIHAAEQFRGCGTKAFHLALLSAAGFAVPPFLCIEASDLKNPDALLETLETLGMKPPYAVRSSSDLEDGGDASYAGQFETFLSVPIGKLISSAQNCFDAESRLCYGRENASQAKTGHVIIQQMVPAGFSGVMFTQNPLGILSEAVITAGRGLGKNIVEDQVPVTTYYYNIPDGAGYTVGQSGSPELPGELIQELLKARAALEKLFGEGLDVEFAFWEHTLYYLQVRKITTLKHRERVILDNSNIAESYPGMTLPLTADFVARQYTAIFTGVVTRLSGSSKISLKYKNVFDHMVECCSGRMYYRIEHWYGVIGLLPFSRRIIPLWREMLGVSQGDKEMPEYRVSFVQKASIARHTFYFFFCAPRKMEELRRYMSVIEQEFDERLGEKASIRGLKETYDRMTALVMDRWDYTLINDMYTFLHTGLFRYFAKKRGMPEEEALKQIADISYLESMKLVQSLLGLALERKRNGESGIFRKGFKAYLKKYGDRSIGELKLETETFRERPEYLMEQISRYAELPDLEELLERLSKEREETTMKGLPGYFLTRAKRGIAYREESRLNRTRLFGYARTLFLEAGRILKEQGRLSEERDVFYLGVDEVFDDSGEDFRERVSQRKYIYESYASYPGWGRIIFDGKVVQKPCNVEVKKEKGTLASVLQGTPCSPGKAAGEVLIVENAEGIGDVAGKILVTRSTDPGWAFLLTGAAGLISEKGSLLSHTAIIARELKIPAVTAVSGATEALRSGDRVEMDCETGMIRRLDGPV